MIIPSSDIITEADNKTIALDIIFTHPMENGPIMEMGKPKQFGVLIAGEKKEDLLSTLKSEKINDKTIYQSTYKITAPADYIFYIEPTEYWEPAEEKMIIHYTKVIVDAFGAEEGWDADIGLPVEIEPLVRPYGLWTGNTFRGIVKHKNNPVPFAEVEVEYYNSDNKIEAPSDPFITQVIKTDQNGVFSYTMPRAGWWGFAALLTSDEKLKSPEGKEVEVELGGLIWVKTVDMK